MISPGSWWWPSRPPRVPKTWTAGLLAGVGVVLFGASALLVKAGATSADARLFWTLNDVSPAAASVLTPLSHLFPLNTTIHRSEQALAVGVRLPGRAIALRRPWARQPGLEG